jgi:hypothetical protein
MVIEAIQKNDLEFVKFCILNLPIDVITRKTKTINDDEMYEVYEKQDETEYFSSEAYLRTNVYFNLYYNFSSSSYRYSESPLAIAVSHGNLDIVKFLLKNCVINQDMYYDSLRNLVSVYEPEEFNILKYLIQHCRIRQHNYDKIAVKSHLDRIKFLTENESKVYLDDIYPLVSTARKHYITLFNYILTHYKKFKFFNTLSVSKFNERFVWPREKVFFFIKTTDISEEREKILNILDEYYDIAYILLDKFRHVDIGQYHIEEIVNSVYSSSDITLTKKTLKKFNL